MEEWGRLWKHSPTFLFVLPILACETFAQTVVAPVLPDTLLSFFDHSYFWTAIVKGCFDACGAFVSFLVASLIGRISDGKGRRYAFLLSIPCVHLQYFALALSPILGKWPYLCSLLLSKVSSFGVAFAYVSDYIQDGDTRSRRFSQISAIIFTSLIIGPVTAASLQSARELCFLAASGISLLVRINLCLCCLPQIYLSSLFQIRRASAGPFLFLRAFTAQHLNYLNH